MIFSFLKIRKKTSAVIGGLLIGAACLWGVAMWQDISPQQLFELFVGSFLLILGIIVLALAITVTIKLLTKLVSAKPRKNADHESELDR